MSIITAIAERAWPAWIWDCDRRVILAANDAALARWGLPASFDTSALIFREDDPGVIAINGASAQRQSDDTSLSLEVPLPFDGAPHFYQLRPLPELGEGIVMLEAPLGGLDPSLQNDEAPRPGVPTWSPELADAIPLPILLCDLDGHVIGENQEAAAHRARQTRSDRLGHLSDWIGDSEKTSALVKQIGSDGHANLIARATDRIDEQTLQVFGHRLSDPSWDTARLLFVLHALPEPLKREEPLLRHEDERMQWRRAAESAAPFGFEVSARGRVVFFTRSCPGLFEVSATQLGGARLEEIGFSWDDTARAALERSEGWETGVLTRTLSDGETLKFETSGNPSFDATGALRSVQVVGRHLGAAPLEREAPATREKPPLPTKSSPAPRVKMPLDYNALTMEGGTIDDNLVRLDDWRPADSPSHLPEGEFAAFVKDLDAALLGLDGEGRIRFANGKAAELLDHDAEDLDGHRITSFFEKGFGALLGAYFSPKANPSITKTFHEGVTATLKLADGATHVISIRLHPLREESAIKYCVLLQPEAEEASATPAAQVTETKGSDLPLSKKESDFLALVSHEIRTPLNAILGFSDLMLQENFGPLGNARYKDYINDIHESGALILSLVEDLLSRSKGEDTKKRLKLKPLDLRTLIQKAQRLMAPQAKARNVRLTVQIEKETPRILGDDRSVLQILLNIVSNAIKYSRAGGDVVIWAGALPNGRVRIHIQDNGIGMSEADMEIAMKPYGRTDEAARQGIKGTGLGLPLAKALAIANQADFKIDSAPKSGTMVRIDFRAASVAAE